MPVFTGEHLHTRQGFQRDGPNHSMTQSVQYMWRLLRNTVKQHVRRQLYQFQIHNNRLLEIVDNKGDYWAF